MFLIWKIKAYKIVKNLNPMNFIKFCLGASLNENPLIIAIQGETQSGEDIFASYLENTLKSYNFNVLRLCVKSYWRTIKEDEDAVENYDFNNPAAVDWDLMRKTFEDLRNKKKATHYSAFDFFTGKSKPYLQKNVFPNVIILNGNFALNLFNKKIYNVVDFNCMKPQNQKIEVEYIENPDDFSKDFNIIRILYLLDKEEFVKIGFREEFMYEPVRKRSKIDNKRRSVKKAEEKTAESDLRWVNYPLQYDFIVDKFHNGTNTYNSIVVSILKSLKITKTRLY